MKLGEPLTWFTASGEVSEGVEIWVCKSEFSYLKILPQLIQRGALNNEVRHCITRLCGYSKRRNPDRR